MSRNQYVWNWGRVNIAANLTNSTLDFFADPTTPAAVPRAIVMMRPGHISGIGVYMSGNAAGSTLVATVFKNGSATAITVTVATGTLKNYSVANSISVVAGDEIDIRITTTSGWTATTVDCTAGIEIH